MRPGPKLGYKQSPEHIEKRIRKTAPEKLARRLRCGGCGFAWLYDGKDGTVTKCPLCGKKKEARNRKEQSRRYLEQHPERKQRLSEWLSKNQVQHSRDCSNKTRQTVFALVSRSDTPSCARCGCDDLRLLEINHKNGGGGKEFASAKNAQAIYRDIAMLRRPVDDLELLCRVCNARHYLEIKFGPLPIEVIWNSNRTMNMAE